MIQILRLSTHACVLEMPVPWGNQQEQHQQQWSGSTRAQSAMEGRGEDVTKAL